ncbi:hypothetical protein MSAR_31410 [Mycolicibacterium sarraceniae]|uniref:Uncharacterized protein n=1 Tax=Mycolicibacterium sarraceniae TaxID=1534348 RepID=A0A7I7SVD5_9MYCO|nr:hypothetical protein MSAR_31410 [Mycolicibacterium sarraceniae]
MQSTADLEFKVSGRDVHAGHDLAAGRRSTDRNRTRPTTAGDRHGSGAADDQLDDFGTVVQLDRAGVGIRDRALIVQ